MDIYFQGRKLPKKEKNPLSLRKNSVFHIESHKSVFLASRLLCLIGEMAFVQRTPKHKETLWHRELKQVNQKDPRHLKRA